MNDINNDKARKVIAIDGPSGVGKGTLTKFLAGHLEWSLLDSGALYRIVAYYANINNIDLNKDENYLELSKVIADFKISFLSKPAHPKWGVRVILNDQDITECIRSEDCGKSASILAQKKLIREALLNLQRNFGAPNNLVADGRDMGSVVFTGAVLKLFLTASDEVRASRRYKQLCQADLSVTMAAILRDLKSRDERDRNRSVSPLKPADDAIILDTSELSASQVQQRVLELIKKYI